MAIRSSLEMRLAEDGKKRPLILIADGDQLTRLSCKQALEKAGFRVSTAPDGASALENFRNLRPDLVLLDVTIPGTDGLSVCRAIRTMPGHGNTPILMATGSDDQEAIHGAFEAGATDFIAKPIAPELLVFRTRYVLRANQSIQKLTASESRLSAAHRLARLGSWEWDPCRGLLWGSHEMCRIMGNAYTTRPVTFENFLFSVYVPDRRKTERALKDACATRSSCTLEFRIKRPDGTLRDVRLVGEADRSVTDRLPHVIGTLQDITESKQVEEQLSLLKQAVDSLPIGITISDIHGKIIYSNPAEARIHGYTVEELAGRHARMFAPENLRAPFTPERLNKFGSWTRESVNIRKDGNEFPVQLSSIVVKNAEGRHLGVVTTCEDITSRKESEERIYNLAYHDHLTGLPNRRTFIDRLHQALALAQREERKLGLLFLDLDNFKDVNDSQGHNFGDKLLQEVAQRLSTTLRDSDTVARIGGDEFVVLLTSLASHASAASFAQRVIDTFSDPFPVDGQTTYTSVSIGIALYPDDSQDAEGLFKCADTAMYHAKSDGRRNYRFYSDEMNEKIMRRVALEHRLHQGIEQDEFSLLYQPQWDVKTGRLVSVEALVRWQCPDYGVLSPSEFITLAEKTDLIFALGEWVLRAACAQVRSMAREGEPRIRVAVNVSGKQLKQPEFLSTIERVITESGIRPEEIELEFTESVIMEKSTTIISTLLSLKEMGVRMSIDDFGTGYSSLSYLKHFPVDRIKIDRSFIADITSNDGDATIVAAIISMAHSLNLKVVAEGVENFDQLRFLAGRGCDIVQGFYLAVPMTAEELGKYLEELMRGDAPYPAHAEMGGSSPLLSAGSGFPEVPRNLAATT